MVYTVIYTMQYTMIYTVIYTFIYTELYLDSLLNSHSWDITRYWYYRSNLPYLVVHHRPHCPQE
jgi:hypothetical protein